MPLLRKAFKHNLGTTSFVTSRVVLQAARLRRDCKSFLYRRKANRSLNVMGTTRARLKSLARITPQSIGILLAFMNFLLYSASNLASEKPLCFHEKLSLLGMARANKTARLETLASTSEPHEHVARKFFLSQFIYQGLGKILPAFISSFLCKSLGSKFIQCFPS